MGTLNSIKVLPIYNKTVCNGLMNSIKVWNNSDGGDGGGDIDIDDGNYFEEQFGDVVNPDRGYHLNRNIVLYPGMPATVASSNVNYVKNDFSISALKNLLTPGNTRSANGSGIVQLRFDLAHFSSNAYLTDGHLNPSNEKMQLNWAAQTWDGTRGVTQDIPNEVLQFLNNLFSNIRDAGQTAIVRFCYDLAGDLGRGNQKESIQNDIDIRGVFGRPYSSYKANYPGLEPDPKFAFGSYVNSEPTPTASDLSNPDYITWKANNIGKLDPLDLDFNTYWIERHIDNLTPILQNYADIIISTDVGLIGPWGEIHSTRMALSGDDLFLSWPGQNGYKDAPRYVNRVIDKLLSVVPDGRTIQIRNPYQFLSWYNEKKGVKITSANMSTIPNLNPGNSIDKIAMRIGLYNDSYLKNYSDEGTYNYNSVAGPTSRTHPTVQSEITWLGKQSAHIFYGGEAGFEQAGIYQKIEYAVWEAFKTHTSYLRSGDFWTWRDSSSNGSIYQAGDLTTQGFPSQSAVLDDLYWNYRYPSGNSITSRASAYDYFRDRLGYRLVLRKSNVSKSGNILKITGKIENVGFGNIINKKQAYIILQSKTGSTKYTVLTTINPNEWTASSPVHDIIYSCDLTGLGVTAGVYDVYLKVNDVLEKNPATSTLRCIRFANVGMWNATLGGNLLGTINIL